jgi:formylglycine-generating enzyme required for sulfatase activity
VDATLSPFYLSEEKVSTAVWRLLSSDKTSTKTDDGSQEGISWSEAQVFCRAIQSACPSLKVTRLPMEVEWEYMAQREISADSTHRQFQGLADGISEWMQDAYLENAYYAFNNNNACPGSNPTDPSVEHVVRGDPSLTGPSFVTRRLRANDQRSNKGRGFRLVAIPENHP